MFNMKKENLDLSIIRLSYDRIKKKPYIWILLLVCFYIIVAYYFDKIRIPSSFSMNTTESINSIAYTISISYISGMIFYILSVFLPHIRKTRSVLKNIVEDLRLFKDHFLELWCTLSVSWLEEEEQSVENKLFKIIAQFEYSKDLINKTIKIEGSLVSILKEYVRKFDLYLKTIMIADAYFTPDEYNQLSEIRNSYSFSQIRIHFGAINGTYYNPEDLMKVIRDLIKVNEKVVSLLCRSY